MSDEKANPARELEVMRIVADALSTLDEAAISRVLRWAADALAAKSPIPSAQRPDADQTAIDTAAAPSQIARRYENLPDFYAAISPASDPEKALAVGYWVQIINGESEFDSFTINKELKQMGYGVSNITSAFSSLMNRRPAMVIQTRKSGNSQQARKTYKLTIEGQRAIEKMLP